MVQSSNTKVEFTTNGVSYLACLGNKVGKFLIGDKGLEFYHGKNVEDYIQIPWNTIKQIRANVSRKKVSRHFEILTDNGKFLFASKNSGKILKIARKHIGNDKIVRAPTLFQIILRVFKRS